MKLTECYWMIILLGADYLFVDFMKVKVLMYPKRFYVIIMQPLNM